ncbi:MAG: gamma-glutamyltranspeptidase / glutathione hydrolase [Solirubrobacteraceae bacterium]|jgi:gamma-glutamyltranspeptidase/glutathione hydrolase|nr:gamma-glutamyltranspeptidase / glutathione hydrolase [Solirubrobacteraceae bacterium]
MFLGMSRSPRLVGLTLAAALVLGAAPPALAQAVPTPAPPATHAVALGSGGAVATVDRDASRTALAVLRQGGNAIDAAIAANATLGVTEPYVAGIGGGGFMVIYLAHSHRVITIDGRETAPSRFTTDAFIDPATGRPIPFYPQRVTSGMAVGVPGTLATWDLARRRYGTMSLHALLQPAAALADRGFVVDQTFHDQTLQNLPRFSAFAASRALFLGPDGQPPTVGSVLRNPDLARTYRLLERRGQRAFYHGPIGTAVVLAADYPHPVLPNSLGFTVPGGVMRRADLAAYAARPRTPTHVAYRGLDVYGMAPPSSGGTTVGEALKILSGFDLGTPDRALALHRYIEALRLAYADRNRYVGDPSFVNVPVSGLLSDAFAARRRCSIGGSAAISPVAFGDPLAPLAGPCPAPAAQTAQVSEGPSTNHLVVADRQGNVVSYTSTIEQIGGSAIAVPGYGFLLNNELTDFNPQPATPGVPDPNLPAPGKRPRSSMAPTIVLRHGRPLLALGSPGGSTIITTVLQILLNRFDFGMPIAQAVAAPRATQQNQPTTTAEPGFIAAYGSALTDRFGQHLVPIPEIGAAAAVEFRPRGRLEAVAEPVRRGGGDAEVVRPAAGR